MYLSFALKIAFSNLFSLTEVESNELNLLALL